ncbi:MAG TPA: molybdopterin oxidoreductase family protein [Rudaea sp.]|jgi:anaerobic selenocysteine-containing dehydrogenase|nr:molybdopterin oxidoreductase family protein [Rudaea sp.]
MPHTQLKLNEPVGDEVKTTTCYMCACRCGIKVHLKNGRVRYIQGNPAHPVNKGVLCAKGSAGIMQHYSPARLRKPLLRVGERGTGEFREIEWDEALALATKWLGDIRARNPDELAFFTGRDQSQALTSWWAQQFGTINYAAHGGFCSVNMAAAGMYTLGGSFWEFGEPDWEHTKFLLMFGVAEDHDSNPIKLGLGKLKSRGAKIVAINPVRTGYAAIADEWIGIRPGTDGLFVGALIRQLLIHDRIDFDYLVKYTNAHHLVVRNPGGADDGLIARDAQGNALCWDKRGNIARPADSLDTAPAIVGEFTLPDGHQAMPAFALLAERFLSDDYAPEHVAPQCGVDAATIRRIAAELADVAFNQEIRLPQRWIDTHGRVHEEMIGRPVSMHAMRGIAAHANGFHTCRMIHVLQMLLGAIDTPGSFRYQPPYPKSVPPATRPGKSRKENGALNAGPLGYVHAPEDLVVDAQGKPRRIDKAFSWEFPLAAHGMLQSVIRNAWAGDPYRIDTLFLFMTNMGWNSAMNTRDTQRMLCDKDADGAYSIPRFIYADAYWSETVNYADLVLPDTTYLERHDCMSLLDRPISDADGAADAIRQPVCQPDRDVRPFQDVLLHLGARLKLPGMVDADGAAKYPRGYAQYMVEHERAPGVGLLAGWRGCIGDKSGVGEPNPDQLDVYKSQNCHWEAKIPESARYYKMANREYLTWAKSLGFVGSTEPIVLEIYSERLQKFRLAAQGHGAVQPPERERARVDRFFDPLPFWYGSRESIREEQIKTAHPCADSSQNADPEFPLAAITQRPMFMYHAWGSQNAWLRQIAARNFLYLHPHTAQAHGIRDNDWVDVESAHGGIRVQARFHEGTAPGVVWTWNAIGKQRGAWKLAADAPEYTKGFLLNHTIDDLLPPRADGYRYTNADPVTGQAAWFDLKVRITRDESVAEATA